MHSFLFITELLTFRKQILFIIKDNIAHDIFYVTVSVQFGLIKPILKVRVLNSVYSLLNNLSVIDPVRNSLRSGLGMNC